ncbi:putative RNA binding protein Pym [Xylariaceae sp. FL0804]|nr:putative RNA binding protein Pym [Xylariaceae sp. FL0804]
MPSQPSTSGIVTDADSGVRHIPESMRADGTTRKAIRIKPGYRPPEDVEVYKNRTAEGFRSRGAKGGGVPGAEGLASSAAAAAAAAGNKNAKRREARKKAKAAEAQGGGVDGGGDGGDNNAAEEAVDPEVEREKRARNLRKKLKQARDLKSKKEGGEALLPEQIAKVIKINELVRELEALGLDAEGEPRTDDAAATATATTTAAPGPDADAKSEKAVEK